MSDAGLDAELNLDISQALEEINRLQAALQAATEQLVVTIVADTSELPGEVEAAVDGADTTAVVEGDAADVTTSTEAAVDGADTTAQIEGDTSQLPGEITAAVDGADTTAVVEGEAGDVTSAVTAAIDASNTTATVTGEAGDVTAAVSGAIDNANTTVRVRGEAGDVTSAVQGAIDASNTTVRVRGDAGDVTSAVQGAIANADTTVRITGDAGDVSAAVTAALQNANTTINIGGIGQAKQQIDDLGRSSQQTTQGMQIGFRQVSTVLAGVLAGSFVRVGAAFNTLQQTSTAALTSVLDGAGAATAQMEELTRFTATSPFPLDEFIRAQQTLIAFGVAAEDVVPTLSAIQDAVAATGQSSDAIGEITTILAQVNSTGKFTADVFNQLGIRGVDAAQLIANEMGITAAEVRESVTAGTLDAQEALTALTQGMQTEFEGAADGVKETFDGAKDRVRAALRDISSALLETFIDPQGGGAAVDFANNLADALRRLEDVVRSGFSDALGRVGAAALDSLLAGLEALEPLIIAGTQGFIALTPVLEVLAGLLAALPPELITFVAAWRILARVTPLAQLAFTRAATSFARVASTAPAAFGAVGAGQGVMARAGTSARGLAAGMGAAAGGLLAAAGPMIALTAGLTILSAAFQNNAEKAREQRQRVQTLGRAMGEADSAAEGFRAGIEDLVASGDKSATALAEAGFSAQDLTDIFLGTGAAVQDVAVQMFELNGIMGVVDFANMAAAAEGAAEAQAALAISSGEISDELGQQIIESDNSFAAWQRYTKALAAATIEGEKARDAAVNQLQAQGRLTTEQADAIRSTEDLADAQALLQETLAGGTTVAEVGAEILARYENATGLAAEQNREFASAAVQVEQALGLLNGEMVLLGDGVASVADRSSIAGGAIAGLGVSVRGTDAAAKAADSALLDLALAIETGAVEGEHLVAVAEALEVPLSDLEGFAAEAAESVLGFASSVESSMPTISDSLGELDKVTFSGIGDALEDTLEDLRDFNDNLSALSPFPELQRLAAEEGPATAAALAGAVEDGKDGMLLEYEAMARDISGEQDAITQEAIDRWGPDYAEALGLVGDAADRHFGDNFGLADTADAEMSLIEATIIAKFGSMEKATSALGEAGVKEYAAAIQPMVAASEGAVDASAESILGGVGAMTAAATSVAAGANDGLRVEAAKWKTTAGSRIADAVATTLGARGNMFSAATSVAAGGNQGLSAEAAKWKTTASSRIGDAVASTLGARPAMVSAGASVAAGANSGLSGEAAKWRNTTRSGALSAVAAVSGVSGFSQGAAVGASIGSGMSSGIAGAVNSVVSAATSLANSAIAGAKSALKAASPSQVFVEIGEDVGDGFVAGLLAQQDAVRAAAEELAQAVVIDPPDIPIGDLDPQIAGLAGRTAAVGGPTTININAGAIVIQVPPGTGPAEARQLGREAERGFSEALRERQILVDARSA